MYSGAVGSEQARARVDDPDLVGGFGGRAGAALGPCLRPARKDREDRRRSRERCDALPTPYVHLPDLREKKSMTEPQT